MHMGQLSSVAHGRGEECPKFLAKSIPHGCSRGCKKREALERDEQ